MISFADQQPAFAIGQLVCHRRYGYRGLVVALDRRCNAPEEWYLRNRTQPSRHQAWYHVLVHGAGHATYAAQSNLQADESRLPIEHPMLDKFFGEFVDGRYVRNEREWQSW